MIDKLYKLTVYFFPSLVSGDPVGIAVLAFILDLFFFFGLSFFTFYFLLRLYYSIFPS